DQNRASGTVATGYTNSVYGYGYDRYGNAVGVGYSAPATAYVTNEGQINNLLAVNMATETAMRIETWKNISDAMADARKKMTLKYQVEFPAGQADPKKGPPRPKRGGGTPRGSRATPRGG